MTKISVCIPVYEMHGNGVKYLNDLLESIYKQTYKNYEIVISDHSKDDAIKNFCDNKENVKYLRNELDRGSSSCNLNNAIRHSSGDIIKVMFQDDYLINNEVFAYIIQGYEHYKGEFKWGAVGFAHVDGDSSEIYRPMLPTFIPDNIKNGINQMGCPSVIFMSRECLGDLFDEKLVWLMDTEYYYRLFLHYGNPFFINIHGICIRLWGNSVTNHVTAETMEYEKAYVIEKFKEYK